MNLDPDLRLIEGVRRGDHGALADLYGQHAAVMLGLAVRILRDRNDAEDLVHDVFLEAWRKADAYVAQRGSVRAWLLLRVRSRAIDRVRSLAVARRHAALERAQAPDPAVTGSPEDPSLSPDQRRAYAALRALPEAQRIVVELAYFQGLSCSEIATREEAPLGTVKSRLAAGMRRLREQFAPPGAGG